MSFGLILVGCARKDENAPTQQPIPQTPSGGPFIPNDLPAAANKTKPLGKPDFVVDAAVWYAEFKADRTAAGKKYQGKVIELTGEVHRVDAEPFHRFGYIYLKVEGTLNGIRCATSFDEKPWLKVKEGSKVRIKGRSDGEIGSSFDAVEISEPGPRPEVLDAAQLAKEVRENRVAAKKRYEGKQWNVAGEIVEISKSKNDRFLVKIKGESEIEVHLDFVDGKYDELKTAKPGQRLRVYGEPFWYNDRVILFSATAISAIE